MKINEMKQAIKDFYRPNNYGLKKYLVKDGKEHPFAIICPGGGYSMVCSFVEGEPYAKALNKLGYHAFVVYYRVRGKAQYPNPQLDLQRAINYVFSKAEEWNVCTNNWSLWGSSAGGHLVSSFCMEDYKTPLPTALILSYPVITLGEYTHIETRNNILGENLNKEMIDKLSVEKHITSNYPPTYVWYGTNDNLVNPINSIMLGDALTKAGVINKVEKFEGVVHGAGLASKTNAEGWLNNAVAFWEEQSKK